MTELWYCRAATFFSSAISPIRRSVQRASPKSTKAVSSHRTPKVFGSAPARRSFGIVAQRTFYPFSIRIHPTPHPKGSAQRYHSGVKPPHPQILWECSGSTELWHRRAATFFPFSIRVHPTPHPKGSAQRYQSGVKLPHSQILWECSGSTKLWYRRAATFFPFSIRIHPNAASKGLRQKYQSGVKPPHSQSAVGGSSVIFSRDDNADRKQCLRPAIRVPTSSNQEHCLSQSGRAVARPTWLVTWNRATPPLVAKQ